MSEFVVKVKSEYLIKNLTDAPRVSSAQFSNSKANQGNSISSVEIHFGKDEEVTGAGSKDSTAESSAKREDSGYDNSKSGVKNKKRPRDTRVAQEDRLCSSVNRGETCRCVIKIAL